MAEQAPQGAPLTPTRSMAVGEMAEMLTTGRAPQGAPPVKCHVVSSGYGCVLPEGHPGQCDFDH